MNTNFEFQHMAYLTVSPKVLEMIEHHRYNMDWSRIQTHEWALPLLLKYPEQVAWNEFYHVEKWMLPLFMANPLEMRWGWFNEEVPEWMEPFFQQHLSEVDWELFNYEPWMLPYIMREPDEILWDNFGTTVPDWMRPYFEKHREHIMWGEIHYMPWMIDFMIRDAADLEWDFLNKYPEQWMLPLFMAHPDHVDPQIFGSVQGGYEAWMLPFFEANPDKINWFYFDQTSRSFSEYAINNRVENMLKNPFAISAGLLTYNYDVIKCARLKLHEDFFKAFYHPTKIWKWLLKGYSLDEFGDYE